jgi:hypothetical protein
MILSLSQVWINRLDTGQAISGYSEAGRSQQFQMQLDVRTYASGRRRAISTRGEQGEVTFRLQVVDKTTKDLLRTWAGIAVQVRDHRGQKWFGVFNGVDVGEWMDPGIYNVGFTLQLTTVNEGV